MKYNNSSSMLGAIMIGAGLLLSGGLITELANATLHKETHQRAVLKAKKLDVNNDGLISLEELTRRQNRHSRKLNHEEDSEVSKAELNARMEAMFNRMDSNSDGLLDDVEIQN